MMTDTIYHQAGAATPIAGNDLETAFKAVGTRFGYDEVRVDYASYKEFKSTWRRCGTKISFEVSDYLRNAPLEVLVDFAHALYERIERRSSVCHYSDRLKAYLESDVFVGRNQATYVKRSRNLTRSPRGRHLDLRETYEALVARGMVPPSEGASLNWTRSENRMRVGYCSVLMRVVAISSLLDNEKVPDFVPEYVLYHELLHLDDGLSEGRRHHTPEFRLRERQHPQWRESEDWLKRLAARRVDLA
ncbi:MAG: M48 family metallopeptidase [Methanomassiliicoccus sp.]|nr:M48 family metallopeptidase [Methanomassiliicoccus sp.]